VAAEDAARYVVVVDGLDKDALGLEVFCERMSADQTLFLTGIDGEEDRIFEGILAHDAGQLEDHGGPGGIVPDAGGAAADVAVVGIPAIHMRFNNDQGSIRRLTAG
jgi:hypothetical protein